MTQTEAPTFTSWSTPIREKTSKLPSKWHRSALRPSSSLRHATSNYNASPHLGIGLNQDLEHWPESLLRPPAEVKYAFHRHRYSRCCDVTKIAHHILATPSTFSALASVRISAKLGQRRAMNVAPAYPPCYILGRLDP